MKVIRKKVALMKHTNAADVFKAGIKNQEKAENYAITAIERIVENNDTMQGVENIAQAICFLSREVGHYVNALKLNQNRIEKTLINTGKKLGAIEEKLKKLEESRE